MREQKEFTIQDLVQIAFAVREEDCPDGDLRKILSEHFEQGLRVRKAPLLILKAKDLKSDVVVLPLPSFLELLRQAFSFHFAVSLNKNPQFREFAAQRLRDALELQRKNRPHGRGFPGDPGSLAR